MKTPTTFPEFNVNDYHVIGYLQGDKIDRCKTLNIESFDSIQLIRNSENTLNKKQFTHAIGWVRQSNLFTVIVLENVNKIPI